MSPHYFHSVVDHVFKSVLGSSELIYIEDCCGHKIVDAAEILTAVFKSLKFVTDACCDLKITYQSYHWMDLGFVSGELKYDRKIAEFAISKYGEALRYASEVLQTDREVVALAVSDSWCVPEIECFYWAMER